MVIRTWKERFYKTKTMKRFFVIITFVGWVGSSAIADLTSSVYVDPFSSPAVQLSWRSEADIQNASYTILCREKTQGSPSFWKAVQDCTDTKEMKSVFHSPEAKTWEFRPAVTQADQYERLVLGDFEFPSDIFLLNYADPSSKFSFVFTFDSDTVYGEKGITISFNYAGSDPATFNPDMRIGVPFANKIKTTDWSGYRYLEFAYWAGEADPVNLYIGSASGEIDLPAVSFSETPNHKGWNQCVVDLDRYLGGPDKRKTIRTFAFTAKANALDLKKTYTFKLDQVCLWKSRNIAETTVDITPPTIVKNLKSKVDKDRITWTWDSSEDKESGVQGYSYYWGKNRGQILDKMVKMNGNEISFPFENPNYHTFYHFMIKACNGAGEWSDPVVESLEFK